MSFHFNFLSNTLLISGTVTFFLGLIIFLRLGKSLKWFGALMQCVAIWSIGYGFELSVTTLPEIMPFVYIEYIGIAFIPAMWLMFTIEFSHQRKLMTPGNITTIFLFPVIVMIMVLTNQYHHLLYQDMFLQPTSVTPMLGIKPGFWYHVHTVYFYLCLVIGNYFLVKNRSISRHQSRSIVIASFIPWMANLLYLVGIRPYDELDLTPFAFIITTVIIGFSIIRFNLFTILPVAHETIIRSLSQAILITDARQYIVDINEAMSRILGVSRVNVIGRKVEAIPVSRQEWIGYITDPGSAKKDVLSEGRYFEIGHTKLLDNQNREIGMIFTAQDITDRKLAEQDLQKHTNDLSRLNATKDKLFSVIAHDLRSPLANLIELLNLAKSGNLTENEFANFIVHISENVEYTSGLLDNLLQWSKSQISGETINPQSFDIYELIERKVKLFDRNARQKHIRIINKVAQNSFVFADKDMIRLVMRNLLSNAVKFCNANDTITISSWNKDHCTVISVEDTGVGMSSESVNKLSASALFTTRGTSNEHGTGLGLMLCREFIEKNGGTLSVKSELGKGSVFSFTLTSH